MAHIQESQKEKGKNEDILYAEEQLEIIEKI